MAGPWIDDSVVLAAVAAAIGKLPEDLEPRWVDAAHDGNAAAADDITQEVVGKGYPASAADTWDQRGRYNKRLALYHALKFGGGGGHTPAELEDLIAGLLKEIRERRTIIADGGAVAPAAGASEVGGISAGMSTAGDDVAAGQDFFFGDRFGALGRGY